MMIDQVLVEVEIIILHSHYKTLIIMTLSIMEHSLSVANKPLKLCVIMLSFIREIEKLESLN